MARKTVYLTVDIMREIAHRLAVNFFAEYNEPMPDFDDHDAALLDSALSLPRATFGRHELYDTLAQKAAVMFYSLIKNHPFPNGNKRIATASLLVFLYLNGCWIKSEQKAIYRWAVRIARSKSEERDELIIRLGDWLKLRIDSRRKIHRRVGFFASVRSVLVWLVPLYWYRRRRVPRTNRLGFWRQRSK